MIEQQNTDAAPQKERKDFSICNQWAKEAQVTQTNPDGFFADLSSSQAAVSVLVALRARPLLPRELYENSGICLAVDESNNTVSIGKDRAYTFDKAFDMQSRQEAVFEGCVKNLVLGCFAGFNATVLAYGQTGSGKTFTMGSGFTLGVSEEDLGIIPRVIRFIFSEQHKRAALATIQIKCAFLEIYNEELIDLLDPSGLENKPGTSVPQKKDIQVKEEKNGSISLSGLNEVTVSSAEEMANCLDSGSHARRTAQTNMNDQSSRSHGIFTVTIEQTAIRDESDESNQPQDQTVAKFHFVDLAGSERAKRTGATGSVFKEGVNINKSLFALGNVISALTDETKKQLHIPYRDSKLTRILQDSLGGNSRTSMIACCSPAETSLEETLNTLKYAARARNIKNKPMINRDPATQQIMELRQQVSDLQREIATHRRHLIENGIQFESTIEVPLGQDEMPGAQSSPAQMKQTQSQVQKLEALVSEQRKELGQKDRQIDYLNTQIKDLKSENNQIQLSKLDDLRQRDEARLQAELYSQKLSELGHPIFNLEQSSSVLDEYRLAKLQLEMELRNANSQLKHLQIDNQQLIQQATRDTQQLEDKQVEIERLKRSNQQWQQEVERLSSTQAPSLTISAMKKTMSTSRFNRRLSTVNQSPQQQPTSNQWLSSQLDTKLKHFDEIRMSFIQDLGTQMSSILTTQTQKQQQDNSPQGSSDSDDSSFGVDSDNDDTADVIEQKSQELQAKSDQCEKEISAKRQHINSLDIQLRDKEAILEQFKQSQSELQNDLLAAMKNEYHLKVDALTRELQRLEQDKAVEMKKQPSNRSRIDENFKLKSEDLQNQINLLQRKDRETKQLSKQLEEQTKKVKLLDQECDKLKTQKVIMMKKAKEEQEALSRLREERAKELQKLKQSLLRKERENAELKRELQKKDVFGKRKQEELVSLQQRQKKDFQKRQNAKDQRISLKQLDLAQIKDWITDNVVKMVEYHELAAERDAKDAEIQAIEAEVDRSHQELAKLSVALEKVESQLSTSAVLPPDELRRLEDLQATFKSQISDCQNQIDNLDTKQSFSNQSIIEVIKALENLRPDPIDSQVMESVQSLEGARACISIFFTLLLEAKLAVNGCLRDLDLKEAECAQIENQLEQTRQLIDAKQRYHETALQELKNNYQVKKKLYFSVIVEKSGVDASGIQEGDLNALLEICFNKQKEYQYVSEALNKGISAKQELKNSKTGTVNQTMLALRKQITELEKKLQVSDSQNQKLQNSQRQVQREKVKLKKDLLDEKSKTKRTALLSGAPIQEDQIQQTALQMLRAPELKTTTNAMRTNLPSASKPGLQFGGRKSIIVETPKLEAKFSNRESGASSVLEMPKINSLAVSFRDKRTARKMLQESGEDHDTVQKEQEQELDDVFNRLNSPVKKVAIRPRNPSRSHASVLQEGNNLIDTGSRWDIVKDSLNAHSSAVQAICGHGSTLYSGDSKCIKVWDVNNMNLLNKIDVPQVKAIQYSPQLNILVASSNKDIIAWDLSTLTKIGEYKGQSEIKCLNLLLDDHLYVGTKGSASQGALLIFDLKKSLQYPIDELEKYKDIFSLACTQTNDYLFCGQRNHKIVPFSLSQWVGMTPLQPPHFDAVTCLTVLNDILVSGSKDKNLRVYNSMQPFEPVNSVMNAHADQINCLENDGQFVYSGSRDGIVKVWKQDFKTADGDLKCCAVLDGNAAHSSVNALTRLDGGMIASANSDWSIRVWKQVDADGLNDIVNLNDIDLMRSSIEESKAQQQIRGGDSTLQQLRLQRANLKKTQNNNLAN